MALISIEEIGACRSGPNNDIDLEAVYGGRIAEKRSKDLKVNPLYNDINGVSQYSDINGNMSPVHVVTYESFPRTRKKFFLSDNGKIHTRNSFHHNGVTRKENASENKSVHVENENLNKVNGNLINGIETNSEIEKSSISDNSVSNLMHLKFKDSELHKSNGNVEVKVAENEYIKHNGNVLEGDAVYAEVKKRHTRGFHKDYNLLGFSNQGFNSDEKDAAKSNKEADTITNKSNEIQDHSEPANIKIFENHTKSVETQANVNQSIEVYSEIKNPDNATEANGHKNHTQDELSESTYEYLEICDVQNPESDNLQNPHDQSGLNDRDQIDRQDGLIDRGDSPLICHEEIVTEVLVHNSAILDSPKSNSSAYKSYETHKSDNSDLEHIQVEIQPESATDWPDIDDLVRHDQDKNIESEIAQSVKVENETECRVRSVSDLWIDEAKDDGPKNVESEISEICESKVICDHDKSSFYKKKRRSKKSSSKSGEVSEAESSTRTLKSILSNGSSQYSCSSETDHKRQNSDSEIHELKTVKFSKDTVFNENKLNKYKKEKFGLINLRDLYKGKVMSDTAIAKMNPLFQPDEGCAEGETEGESGSERLRRDPTLKNALRLSKEMPTDLNSPSYLEQYLILKAHGMKRDNIDIEKLPETIEQPVYDRLIERTLAKERRKFCVKWSMVILTVAIITAVATTLSIYFKEGL